MVRTPFMRVLRRREQIITATAGEGVRLAARRPPEGRYAGRVSSRTGIVVVVLAALALPLGTAAAAKRVVTVDNSRHLWATINVCDPADPPADIGPDTIGIRASMPGSADGRELMYMRFRVQYLKDADQKWHNVVNGGDSDWHRVGRAEIKAIQSGRTFRFSPPSGKPTVLLRGKVNFEWRLRGEVTRRAVKLTTKGHTSKAGAFPAGYSEATCTITA
jgi:hypothetical protein